MAMEKYQDTVIGENIDSSMNVMDAATVSVYDVGTANLATIYSDEGTTPKSNPTTTDSVGYFFLYAADGDYDIKIEKAGFTTQNRNDVTLFAGSGVLSTNGGAMAGMLILAKGADVASAAALTLGSDGNYFDITGTTGITSIVTKGIGATVRLHFDAVLTLAHHASDLILPTGANIITAAGDEAEFVEYATGDWRCIQYTRASGKALKGEDYILIRDEKSATTAGGTFTQDAWQTRDLNTEVVDTGSNVSLATNQITLGAGTYRVRCEAPAFHVSGHQARLYNITDTTTILIGSSGYCLVSDDTNNNSVITGRFTITSAKVLEVQHYCLVTGASSGFGAPASISGEVYTVIELWKEV